MKLDIFGTPIWRIHITGFEYSRIQNEIDQCYDNVLFEKKKEWETNIQSLTDSTFSKNFIKDNNLKNLEKSIIKYTNDYIKESGGNGINPKIISSWMTKTEYLQHSPVHDHNAFDIAGVYYYKKNFKDAGFEIINPTSGNLANKKIVNASTTLTLFCKQGELLLFPGWLLHRVKEQYIDIERLSISFNINLE
jgi:uncharacterized protein (TIGR02466 family)